MFKAQQGGRGGWDELRELKAAIGLMVEAPLKGCCELYLAAQGYLRGGGRIEGDVIFGWGGGAKVGILFIYGHLPNYLQT